MAPIITGQPLPRHSESRPGVGHYPWLDDLAWFTARLLAFLG